MKLFIITNRENEMKKYNLEKLFNIKFKNKMNRLDSELRSKLIKEKMKLILS